MKLKICSMALAAAMAIAVSPLWAAGAAARPARAAAAAQQSAPAATTNPNEGFLRTWKDVSRKLVDQAEDFPEDKYDYKPVPEVRTFAEQMIHVTSAVYYFKAVLDGSKMPEEVKRSEFKSKAEIVAYAKKALAEGSAMLEKADFSKTIQGRRRAINPYEFWSDFCEHAGEHYGQMVVYYRLNGIVPPESRPKKK
jgi:uncharacterized damage-inducible protein DinB